MSLAVMEFRFQTRKFLGHFARPMRITGFLLTPKVSNALLGGQMLLSFVMIQTSSITSYRLCQSDSTLVKNEPSMYSFCGIARQLLVRNENVGVALENLIFAKNEFNFSWRPK